MGTIWRIFVIFLTYYPFIVASVSLESLYFNLVHRNISDFTSFDSFYRDLLKDTREHRLTDTVSSPINIDKILLNDYNEDYIKNSCYETASDLLYAHGYNRTNLNLSINDIKSLLPALLYSVENPGCKRQLPPTKPYPFFDIWIFGLIFIVAMKFIHLIIFFISGNHSSVLTSGGLARAILNHADNVEPSTDEVRFSPVKYHLWLGLSFNAFTCGIILGTVSYHLIPHIYEVPNEDFSYTYILRGTVVLCGVFLFFIVEKLLRFRFKVDEAHLDEPSKEKESSDAPVIQMAKMRETLHVHNRDPLQHKQSDSPIRLPSTLDNIDETTGLQSDQEPIKKENHAGQHEHQTRNFIIYHIIYDFSNDIIYGCGLSTALSHDRLIGFVLWLMIFSEGFRRHSQLLSSLGRKLGFGFLFFSVVFLILGYIIGGILTGINQQFTINFIYIPKEYIYAMVYGALFYTALVTLIPELNDFGQHLHIHEKTANQTLKKQRTLKIFVFICQNVFLVIGVLIALILAIIWRYYHRKSISEYICPRDSFRPYCRF
ncbi:unnamed protein product [Adineta steineri]|uniref:Uncharacterized protein n=1 Tax=Adineta steineri TaxID=433720 RepID=A0A814ZZE6_9BILA|nr:unnamed protein product [Adineta steineri]